MNIVPCFGKMWGYGFVLKLLCAVCVASTDIDQLITISGMVIRTSQLIPEMQEAFFQCQVCAYSTRVEVDRGRIAEPAVCRHCNNTHSLALVHNRSVFSDKQMVRVGWEWGVCNVRDCLQSVTPQNMLNGDWSCLAFEVMTSLHLLILLDNRSKFKSLRRTCRPVRRLTRLLSMLITTWLIKCSQETA